MTGEWTSEIRRRVQAVRDSRQATNGATPYRGLSTPAKLAVAEWVNKLSRPGEPADMGIVGYREVETLLAVACDGIITATLTDPARRVQRVYAAITPLGRSCLATKQRPGVYAALATTVRARITTHTIAHPHATITDLATAIGRANAHTNVDVRALCTVQILTRHADPDSHSTRHTFTATPLARLLLDAAEIPYTLPGVRDGS